MSSSREQVIAEARAAGHYQCAKCRYELRGVPTDEAGHLTCPECGFEMRFVVLVQLVRGDDKQIQQRDESLRRGERAVLLIAICILLIFVLSALLIF